MIICSDEFFERLEKENLSVIEKRRYLICQMAQTALEDIPIFYHSQPQGVSVPAVFVRIAKMQYGKRLAREIEWLCGKKLPVSCPKNPDLYVMCEKNGDTMSVLLLNCFADKILTPTVMLDRSYTSVECVGCEAYLDGNKLIFKSDIEAFGFVTFRLS